MDLEREFNMPGLDVFGYLKISWPGRGASEYNDVLAALELCKYHKCVRVPWQAITDPTKLNDQGEIMGAKISRQVPPTFGVADGLNYFHGTGLNNPPKMRRDGVHPSPEGAGSNNEPALYCGKNRSLALSYSTTSVFIFPPLTAGGEPIKKCFKCLIGIGSSLPWPHHSFKVERKNARFHQFGFRYGTYQPLWCEFHPQEPWETSQPWTYAEVIDRTGLADKKQNRRYATHYAQAFELIYEINEDTMSTCAAAPAKRQKWANPRMAPEQSGSAPSGPTQEATYWTEHDARWLRDHPSPTQEDDGDWGWHGAGWQAGPEQASSSSSSKWVERWKDR
jgi:hypothetical protein